MTPKLVVYAKTVPLVAIWTASLLLSFQARLEQILIQSFSFGLQVSRGLSRKSIRNSLQKLTNINIFFNRRSKKKIRAPFLISKQVLVNPPPKNLGYYAIHNSKVSMLAKKNETHQLAEMWVLFVFALAHIASKQRIRLGWKLVYIYKYTFRQSRGLPPVVGLRKQCVYSTILDGVTSLT